jgi:hypothetical protein
MRSKESDAFAVVTLRAYKTRFGLRIFGIGVTAGVEIIFGLYPVWKGA